MQIKDNLDLAGARNENVAHNIASSAKFSGKTRSTEWLFRKAEQNRFVDVDVMDSMKFAETIDSMLTVFKQSYGKNFDVHLEPSWKSGRRYYDKDTFEGYNIRFVVYYPNIEITNTKEVEHTIKDLFVVYPFRQTEDGVFYLGPPHGARGTMSYPEWFKGYIHSHITSNQPSNFSSAMYVGKFCLGDNEVNDLNMNLKQEYSADYLTLLLMTVDTMVAWESLEGTPYNYIEKISIGKEYEVTNLTAELEALYVVLRNAMTSFDVDFVFSSGRYKIVHNQKFLTVIKTLIISELSEFWKSLLVTKTGEKLYGYDYPEVISAENITKKFQRRNYKRVLENPFTYIQGKKIEFKVTPFDGEMPSFDAYDIHPKFLSYVSTQIEKEIYVKTIRKAALKRESINQSS